MPFFSSREEKKNGEKDETDAHVLFVLKSNECDSFLCALYIYCMAVANEND